MRRGNSGVMEMLNGGNVTVDSDTILMIVFPEIFSFTPEIPHALWELYQCWVTRHFLD